MEYHYGIMNVGWLDSFSHTMTNIMKYHHNIMKYHQNIVNYHHFTINYRYDILKYHSNVMKYNHRIKLTTHIRQLHRPIQSTVPDLSISLCFRWKCSYRYQINVPVIKFRIQRKLMSFLTIDFKLNDFITNDDETKVKRTNIFF